MKLALQQAYSICAEMIDEYPAVFSIKSFCVYWDSLPFKHDYITKPIPMIYSGESSGSASVANPNEVSADSILARTVTSILLEVSKRYVRRSFSKLKERNDFGLRMYRKEILKIRRKMSKRLEPEIKCFMYNHDISISQMIEIIVASDDGNFSRSP